MDENRNERIAAALETVFRTYQQSDRGDEESVARERIERARVYFEAVAPYDLRDIEAAARALVSGSAPGVNPNFIPPAPVVGAECRRQMNLRLDHEARERMARPKLPPPDVKRSAESRERVKAIIDECVANIAAKSLEPNPESERGRKSIFERTNERFDRERGYSVGDPEGDEAIA